MDGIAGHMLDRVDHSTRRAADRTRHILRRVLDVIDGGTDGISDIIPKTHDLLLSVCVTSPRVTAPLSQIAAPRSVRDITQDLQDLS
jgi:hypothetical protein